MMTAGGEEQGSSQAARAGAALLPPQRAASATCEAVGMSPPPQNGVYTQGQLLTLA